MSPELPPTFTIAPPPESSETTKPHRPEPGVVVIPDEIQQQIDAERASQAEQERVEQLADAARRIISQPPGYETLIPQGVQGTANTENKGKFGTHVEYDVPMPPNPSKVPGWKGEA